MPAERRDGLSRPAGPSLRVPSRKTVTLATVLRQACHELPISQATHTPSTNASRSVSLIRRWPSTTTQGYGRSTTASGKAASRRAGTPDSGRWAATSWPSSCARSCSRPTTRRVSRGRLTVHFLRAPHAGTGHRPPDDRAGRALADDGDRAPGAGGRTDGACPGRLSAPRRGPVISEAPMPEAAPASAREMPPVAPGRLAPPPFTGRRHDGDALRRAAVQRRRSRRGRGLDGTARGAADRRADRRRCSPTLGFPPLGHASASWLRRRPSSSRSTSGLRSPCPIPSCSGDSTRTWCATASSTRTASCGRPTAHSSPARASSGC